MQRLRARGLSETSFTIAKYWEQMPNNKELMNYGMSIGQSTIQLPKSILM